MVTQTQMVHTKNRAMPSKPHVVKNWTLLHVQHFFSCQEQQLSGGSTAVAAAVPTAALTAALTAAVAPFQQNEQLPSRTSR